MTKRFIPLAALAALAALACTPTVAPPTLPTASGSPAATASAGASTAPTTGASTAPGASASPTGSASPAASASPGASAKPAHDHAADFTEGCEHLGEEDGAKAVQASLVTMSRERGVVAADHARYNIGLIKNGGRSEGYVLFENDEEGEFHFFLSQDVPFKLVQGGKDVAFHAEDTQKPLAACPNVVKAHYAADLGVGQVELHFGPTDQTTVGLVLEHHSEEGHDDHDD